MPDAVSTIVDILAVMGAIDLILGVVSKHTKTKVDDNIYAIFHGIVTKLNSIFPWGKK